GARPPAPLAGWRRDPLRRDRGCRWRPDARRRRPPPRGGVTPPAINLGVPASTSTRAPVVSLRASDLYGLPNPGGSYPHRTTFTLDVDTNNDGNFTGGELSYATGTLTNGAASITLPTLPSTGTYTLRAHVLDLAGNAGTSALATLVVSNATNPWVASATVLSV